VHLGIMVYMDGTEKIIARAEYRGCAFITKSQARDRAKPCI